MTVNWISEPDTPIDWVDNNVIHRIEWTAVEVVNQGICLVRRRRRHIDNCAGNFEITLLTENQSAIRVVCSTVQHHRRLTSLSRVKTIHCSEGGSVELIEGDRFRAVMAYDLVACEKNLIGRRDPNSGLVRKELFFILCEYRKLGGCAENSEEGFMVNVKWRGEGSGRRVRACEHIRIGGATLEIYHLDI
jgi:hypothetical protein